MHHSFDIAHASEYGVEEAILISNFQFWILKNKANGENFHDGRTWTYNTVRAWADLFPYLSIHQVRRAIEKLQAAGVLIAGNYNETRGDQTKWYAFADEARFLPNPDHLANLPNGVGKTAEAVGKTAKCLIRTDVNADERGAATLLSKDWKVPREWKTWALHARPEFTVGFVDEIGERFREHWDGVAKSNWEAAWRKWVRDERRVPAAARKAEDWLASAPGITKKGAEFGVVQGADEAFPYFKLRVIAAVSAAGCPA